MPTATVRIPREKRDTLKIIASVEKRDLKEILSELIDGYIESHRETLELLSRPEWLEMITAGKKEVSEEVKGKSPNDLEIEVKPAAEKGEKTTVLALEKIDITNFCRKWKISQLSVFGSILRDDFSADSDIDVLVSFAPGEEWSLTDLAIMQEELTSIFGREVDLVEETGLRNPFRKKAILESRKVIYAA